MNILSRLTCLLATVLLAVGLAACSDPVASGEKVEADEAVAMIESAERTVIDVRTPAEYAEGHVEGAQLVDAMAPDFRDQIDELDKDEPYLVYCRSGSRSAAAVSLMGELGFTDVVDGGGILDLEPAGATIVTG